MRSFIISCGRERERDVCVLCAPRIDHTIQCNMMRNQSAYTWLPIPNQKYEALKCTHWSLFGIVLRLNDKFNPVNWKHRHNQWTIRLCCDSQNILFNIIRLFVFSFDIISLMNLATILCVNFHFSINLIEMGIYFNNMTRALKRVQCHLYEINGKKNKNVAKA